MKLTAKQQVVIDRLLAKFESGDLSDVTRVATLNPPANSPALGRSINNQLWGMMTTGSIDARTYKQWLSVGRQVRKGESAGFIWAPVNVKKEDEKGEEYYKLVAFKLVAVFAPDQTDAIEGFEGEAYEPHKIDEAKLPPLLDLADRLNVPVSYAPLLGALGSYSLTDRTITLATDDQSVFFHELAHAIHHVIRPDEIRGGQQVEQEVAADFVSCVLMELYGLRDNSGNCFRYISHYADDALTAVKSAMNLITDILAFINE